METPFGFIKQAVWCPPLMPQPVIPNWVFRRYGIEVVMGSSLFWARFVLASLAVWRVTHLLASEDGPGHVIARVRAHLGNSVLGSLMDCFGCLSIWVSIPFAFMVSRRPIMDLVLVWLALSGAAFLLERATSEPLLIERVKETKGDSDHGLLR